MAYVRASFRHLRSVEIPKQSACDNVSANLAAYAIDLEGRIFEAGIPIRSAPEEWPP